MQHLITNHTVRKMDWQIQTPAAIEYYSNCYRPWQADTKDFVCNRFCNEDMTLHSPSITVNLAVKCFIKSNWQKDFKSKFRIKVINLWTNYKKVKVKWSHYRRGVAQMVGRGIALLFHDRGTRRGWVVSSTPRPHFTPGKDPVPILQEAGWVPGPVWTGRKSHTHRDSIPDRPAHSSVTIPSELPGPHELIQKYIADTKAPSGIQLDTPYCVLCS